VAEFVGTNNFISGVCRDRDESRVVVETPLGPVHGRLGEGVQIGARCVVAVRPENVTLDAPADNLFDGRVTFASYLGNALRYEVELATGVLLKVDVGDAWHHEALAMGRAVRVGFASTVALTLRDEEVA
jgi:ABC-type Fe3+/spermidine/putrescine transport system ATPase subunit